MNSMRWRRDSLILNKTGSECHSKLSEIIFAGELVPHCLRIH